MKIYYYKHYFHFEDGFLDIPDFRHENAVKHNI